MFSTAHLYIRIYVHTQVVTFFACVYFCNYHTHLYMDYVILNVCDLRELRMPKSQRGVANDAAMRDCACLHRKRGVTTTKFSRLNGGYVRGRLASRKGKLPIDVLFARIRELTPTLIIGDLKIVPGRSKAGWIQATLILSGTTERILACQT